MMDETEKVEVPAEELKVETPEVPAQEVKAE